MASLGDELLGLLLSGDDGGVQQPARPALSRARLGDQLLGLLLSDDEGAEEQAARPGLARWTAASPVPAAEPAPASALLAPAAASSAPGVVRTVRSRAFTSPASPARPPRLAAATPEPWFAAGLLARSPQLDDGDAAARRQRQRQVRRRLNDCLNIVGANSGIATNATAGANNANSGADAGGGADAAATAGAGADMVGAVGANRADRWACTVGGASSAADAASAAAAHVAGAARAARAGGVAAAGPAAVAERAPPWSVGAGAPDVVADVVEDDVGDVAGAADAAPVEDAGLAAAATAAAAGGATAGSSFASFFGRWARPLAPEERRELQAVCFSGGIVAPRAGSHDRRRRGPEESLREGHPQGSQHDFFFALRAMPPALLTTRDLQWEYAQSDSLDVIARATRLHAEIVATDLGPLLGVSANELRWRVGETLRRHCAGLRGAYIGSSSDPEWRWRGGPSWRSGRRGWMDGHCLRWRKMVVLGSWPDAEAAALEEVAIIAGRSSLGGALENVADDARGLEIRHHPGYSCIYICVQRRTR